MNRYKTNQSVPSRTKSGAAGITFKSGFEFESGLTLTIRSASHLRVDSPVGYSNYYIPASACSLVTTPPPDEPPVTESDDLLIVEARIGGVTKTAHFERVTEWT